RFFETCAEIARRAKVPVQFHFLVGQASGLVFPQVRNLVRRIVGDSVVVHKHQNYHNYMRVIAECDLFLNPFPFGNTNGIVDTVWAGLIGVCKTGREVHEHIDEGMFRRLGFPEWTIARTREDYVEAALRLIDDRSEREALTAKLAGPQAIEKLIFKGRPEILGERMLGLWNEKLDTAAWREQRASGAEILAPAEQARTAEDCLRRCQDALRRHPLRFDVAHGAAMLLMKWHLIDAVDTLWQQAVERQPEAREPRLYRFLHVIASGRLQEGFQLRLAAVKDWPWRRRTTAQPPSAYPAWTGQPLAGKRIVIWSEFGLGDEIFFLRFARILRERAGAASVTVLCQTPLKTLFAASGEANAVVAAEDSATLPEHDYWVYPHDIPAWLPLSLDALPTSVPYLRVPQEAGRYALPGRYGALKVGIVFRGEPNHENDRSRSLPGLSMLDPLFGHAEVDFYSLQKGSGAQEAAVHAAQRSNFYDIGVTAETMLDTARAVACLDLVITVDTSVAHLAGALGKPTWLLLPAYADWRWHYARDDSPWYPTVMLFRHPFRGGWGEVVTRLNGHLLARIAAREAGRAAAREAPRESATRGKGAGAPRRAGLTLPSSLP
ncbi:glycosyltransferase family 9 protein, partial [Cupriavidus agavae]